MSLTHLLNKPYNLRDHSCASPECKTQRYSDHYDGNTPHHFESHSIPVESSTVQFLLCAHDTTFPETTDLRTTFHDWTIGRSVKVEIMRQESSLPVRNCLPQEACDTSGLSAGVQWRDDGLTTACTGLSNSSTHHSIHPWSDTWVDAAHNTCQSGQKRISLFLVMIAWKTKYIIHLVLRTLEWRGNTFVWKA